MPRFFVTTDQITDSECGKTVEITGGDAVHIGRSLRMRIGDAIIVCDGAGAEYSCTIDDITSDSVTARIVSEKQSENESPCRVSVYQALVRGEKFDTVVQKAVECGASEIIPVITSRCEVKLDSSGAAKKVARWQRIADEAAKQCGRAILPRVAVPVTFADGVRLAASAELPMICYEDERHISIADVLRRIAADVPSTASVFVGPEGGFSHEEIASAAGNGMISVGLGKRILRTETASSFALACIACFFEL